MAPDPRPGTKTEYIATLDALARQATRLEDEAVRRAAKLLLEAQREIMTQVVTADGWRLENLNNLHRQVNDILEQFRQKYLVALRDINTKAYVLGTDAVDEPIKVSGVMLTPARLSSNVVAVLQGFSADLITRISNETRDTVNATITRSMLGLMSPFEAQKQIAGLIGAKDRLSELTGISARAEATFRTEVGRVHSIATQARQSQIAEDVPDLVKVWVATGDSRTRDGHLQAHGQMVKVDEFFEVAPHIGEPKEELLYPRDPRGSPANTIYCRCRSVTYRESYGAPMPRTTARVDTEKYRRAKEGLMIGPSMSMPSRRTSINESELVLVANKQAMCYAHLPPTLMESYGRGWICTQCGNVKSYESTTPQA